MTLFRKSDWMSSNILIWLLNSGHFRQAYNHPFPRGRRQRTDTSLHPSNSLAGASSTTFPKKIGKRRKDTVYIIMLARLLSPLVCFHSQLNHHQLSHCLLSLLVIVFSPSYMTAYLVVHFVFATHRACPQNGFFKRKT